MHRRAALLLLPLLLLTGPLSAECGKNPAGSTFRVNTTCDFATPCLEDEPHTLTLVVDTSCYSWLPCKPFPFEACDLVDWDFGDGTTARVTGAASVTHVWANPGNYPVQVRIANTAGEQLSGAAFIAVHKPAAIVHWSTDLYTAGEKDPEITLTLEREGDLSRAVTVLLSAGTRAATEDPWDRNLEHVWDRPVTIPAGTSSLPIKLNIRNDDVYLGEQRYDVFVHDESGETLMPIVSTVAHTEVRILDDEQGPTLTVSDVTVDEGDSGSQIVRIPHVLSQPLGADLMLWWQIGEGTATRGTDWNTTNGGNYFVEQWIRAGQTRADLEIVVLGDRQSEADETIVAKLASPLGPSVAFNQAQVTITIRDDDADQHDVLRTLTFSSDRDRLEAGETVRATLTTEPPSAVRVTLEATPAGIVEIPASVMLDAHGTASFDIEAREAGSATITARLAPEQGGATKAISIEVEKTIEPHIAAVNPTSGPDDGGTRVTISGSDLSPDCRVSLGGVPAVSTWIDAGTLLATTPAHAAGAVDVVVQCGTNATTLAKAFRYVAGRRRAVR